MFDLGVGVLEECGLSM